MTHEASSRRLKSSSAWLTAQPLTSAIIYRPTVRPLRLRAIPLPPGG
jgi:hypothetical protein